MGGPLTPLEIPYPVCPVAHMDALCLSTPVGLDLQPLRESCCYPGSCSTFGKYSEVIKRGVLGVMGASTVNQGGPSSGVKVPGVSSSSSQSALFPASC